MVAQAQEYAEVPMEEAEATIAQGLAELPEVAAVYCTFGGGAWDITVLHDYDSTSKGIVWVTIKLNEIRRSAPHLNIRPMICRASKASSIDTRHEKLIYERQ